MTLTKSIYKFILSGFAAIILSGCASTVPLSQESRKSIRSISISETVSLPDNMFYHGGGQTLGMLFGAVGGAVAGSASQRPADQIRTFMQASNINVDEMVRFAFTDELEKASVFEISDSKSVDAQIELEINMYGLIQVHGYSSRLRPIMAVRGKLIDNNGKVLWIGHGSTPAFTSNLPAHTLAEYSADPELLKKAFLDASRIVALELLSDLNKK
jgi:hypothetical protein